MSTAYYIVLDRDVHFSTVTNGKTVAAEYAKLNALCKSHSLKVIDDLYSQDASDLFDEVEIHNYIDQGVEWYDAQEGVEWVGKLIRYLMEESGDMNMGLLVKELEEYRYVLEQAVMVKAKWHFEIDI